VCVSFVFVVVLVDLCDFNLVCVLVWGVCGVSMWFICAWCLCVLCAWV